MYDKPTDKQLAAIRKLARFTKTDVDLNSTRVLRMVSNSDGKPIHRFHLLRK